ncbi:MAG TPA: hypothetical protein VFS43_33845, partial [Polyangiaceae bacterium]|nr:hypothetical protein [Polyangiaceae bacterium]
MRVHVDPAQRAAEILVVEPVDAPGAAPPDSAAGRELGARSGATAVVVHVERVPLSPTGPAAGTGVAAESARAEPAAAPARVEPAAAPARVEPGAAPAISLDEFSARVERALLHIYHGDTADRRVAYTVRRGELPAGLSGRTYTTVFSYESVMAGPGLAASPNMLTAPARLLTIDFGAGGQASVPVATTTIQNEAWHLRALAPNAFVRSDFAEFSWFGISNLSNTCAVPAFASTEEGRPKRGVRLLLSYDAGRPIEVNPESLGYVTPVGRTTNYHAAVGSLFGPMIMTTGHPVYDPDFDRGRPRLLYTNLVPRVTSFFTVNTPVSADLYLVTWDGGREGPTPPLRVCEGGKPVVMAQASAHQICMTRNYVVVMQATLVLDTASLLKPLSPLLRQQIARAFGGRVPRIIDRLDDAMTSRLRAAVQPSHTDLFFIAKSEIRKALGAGSGSVEAKRVRIDWEATHALADYDDRGGLVTLYCQHNVGADPADQIEPGDELIDGGTANRELEGMFSASTDLNQVRKYVIDA